MRMHRIILIQKAYDDIKPFCYGYKLQFTIWLLRFYICLCATSFIPSYFLFVSRNLQTSVHSAQNALLSHTNTQQFK